MHLKTGVELEMMGATRRWKITVGAVAVLVLGAGACSSADELGLEDLGLAMEIDIQAGTEFEVSVPAPDGTIINVVGAPSGVTAAISGSQGGLHVMTVAVDRATPRGAYRVELQVERKGREYQLTWPFTVIDESADGGEAVGDSPGTYPPPEELREQVVGALLAADPDAVRALWPESSWWVLDENPGLLEDWPGASGPDCERMTAGEAHCLIFAKAAPFVLGLMMAQQGSADWVVTSVTLDSTN